MPHLLLTVRFPGDSGGTARFHGIAQGSPEWPPSPARVFQALIAGGARGDGLPEVLADALAWLEALPPPTVGAPDRWLGQQVSLFVPNNDADALDDPREVSNIRTKKLVQPSLFRADIPLLYAWSFEGSSEHAVVLVRGAGELHRLGRGVDIAWAEAEVVEQDELADRLAAYRGIVHLPTMGGGDGERTLACPVTGSLASLEERHQTVKLRTEGSGRTAKVYFTNPPKPRFALVTYARRHRWIVFELKERDSNKAWPWSCLRIVRFVEQVRDQAAGRLRSGLPGRELDIEAALVGRKSDGRDAAPTDSRVRIVPLPSIGSEHVDRAIRRFAIDAPSGGLLDVADVEWAFSGLTWADPESGELGLPIVVTPSQDEKMLDHYRRESRRWRTVTPAALPALAARRRIDPTRRKDDAKPASERLEEEARAASAVRTALRHANIRAQPLKIHVQREPFESRGAKAEAFAPDTRFEKERLWHVELEFDRLVAGPLLIGDGRFLGLGLLAPVRDELRGVLAFEVLNGLESAGASATDVARALRRAVMSRVQKELGSRTELPSFFSGHDEEGKPARQQTHSHLAFSFDSHAKRALIVAPHVLDRRGAGRGEGEHLALLERALNGFSVLLAGRAGRLELRRVALYTSDDPLVATSKVWTSVTPYVSTRHAKLASARDALIFDVRSECQRLALPTPRVTVEGMHGVAGIGLVGNVTLAFDTTVQGPLLLGRTRFLGGGLFVPAERTR